jgi:predicted nucleotide-binding protein
MALDKVEQKIVEQYFDMRTGYVLHHSNRTFADFFEQFDIDIYNDRYCDIGDSKAKRLRSFFNQHDDDIIGKVILALIEDNDTKRDVNTHSENNELRQSCIDIASRLINSKATAVPSQHRPFVNPFKSQQARAINEIFSAAIPTKPLFVASSCTPSKPKYSQTAPSMTTPSIPEKIFIVHGHDEHLLIETENLLRKLSLDPIVLRDQHSGGKTIIEKLEIHGDVRYAIILYTACDEGRKIGTSEVNPRARQNVVFEHGYFIGRLGRENVAAVVKGTVEIQGDISGVVYHQYQSGWQLELAKEMKRSGLNVDLNHL